MQKSMKPLRGYLHAVTNTAKTKKGR
ncbi:hypothetical protein [Bittarella massiliensis (ex Durand et al. 2017)]